MQGNNGKSNLKFKLIWTLKSSKTPIFHYTVYIKYLLMRNVSTVAFWCRIPYFENHFCPEDTMGLLVPHVPKSTRVNSIKLIWEHGSGAAQKFTCLKEYWSSTKKKSHVARPTSHCSVILSIWCLQLARGVHYIWQ